MKLPEPNPTVRPVPVLAPDPERVGWRFISVYSLSYAGGALLFLAPLLVSLALKVNEPRRSRRRSEEPRARDGSRFTVRDREQPALRPVE